MSLKLHFISGLPRSGSTLLAAILRQNPHLHATVESPVANLCAGLLRGMSGAHETSLFISDDQRRRILRSVIEAYYCEAKTFRTIFDTSRLWCQLLPVLDGILPDSRIVCCIRNVAWILDSLERLVQINGLRPSRVFKHDPTLDVYGRTASLMESGCVGSSLRGLRQAWFGEYSSRIIAIRYEALVDDPDSVINRFYELIGEDPFPHDFDNLEYEEPDFDRYIGLTGMHTVRRRISAPTRRTILPPDLFQRYDQEFWNSEGENPHGVTVL